MTVDTIHGGILPLGEISVPALRVHIMSGTRLEWVTGTESDWKSEGDAHIPL